ncbi:MAG: molybdopterin-dependent oxidoreductase, partial [Trichlorobacter sp.]|uniref:xanthine dehydrogenase family protein molybdopterin-binding subunit n=1 Tax=Trichlorobacter sp. TaxID=2911007 RepID=UPI002565A346|nr:molybdopterin-dependent oxidoreductase [Trichlorobacter sp.]
MNASALKIGASHPRGDAAAKAAGTEPYAADRYPANCLWAGAVRSNLPAGRIISIDTSAAKALPGVVAVLTAADLTASNRQGIIHKDMPVLCDTVVRYIGDPLALVLAEDRSTLHQALELVRFELEPLAGLFDLDSALAADAPLIHEDKPGNLLAQATICKGQGLDGFSDCAVVVEGSFSTPVQAHAFLETESGVARLEEDGGLLMDVSTQSPFRDRFEISHALGIPWGCLL